MPRDNSDTDAKLAVRRRALELVRPVRGPALVLDCYAGEGHMFREVWHEADRYLGLEKRFSRPPGDPAGECWRGDNVRLLRRAMEVAPWNIVDLDGYGSPWQFLAHVVRLSREKRLVVTATCGMVRALAFGTCAHWIRELTGVGRLSSSPGITLLARWNDDIARWAIAYAIRGTGFGVVEAHRALAAVDYRVKRVSLYTRAWYYLLVLERSGS